MYHLHHIYTYVYIYIYIHIYIYIYIMQFLAQSLPVETGRVLRNAAYPWPTNELSPCTRHRSKAANANNDVNHALHTSRGVIGVALITCLTLLSPLPLYGLICFMCVLSSQGPSWFAALFEAVMCQTSSVRQVVPPDWFMVRCTTGAARGSWTTCAYIYIYTHYYIIVYNMLYYYILHYCILYYCIQFIISYNESLVYTLHRAAAGSNWAPGRCFARPAGSAGGGEWPRPLVYIYIYIHTHTQFDYCYHYD